MNKFERGYLYYNDLNDVISLYFSKYRKNFVEKVQISKD